MKLTPPASDATAVSIIVWAWSPSGQQGHCSFLFFFKLTVKLPTLPHQHCISKHERVSTSGSETLNRNEVILYCIEASGAFPPPGLSQETEKLLRTSSLFYNINQKVCFRTGHKRVFHSEIPLTNTITIIINWSFVTGKFHMHFRKMTSKFCLQNLTWQNCWIKAINSLSNHFLHKCWSAF